MINRGSHHEVAESNIGAHTAAISLYSMEETQSEKGVLIVRSSSAPSFV